MKRTFIIAITAIISITLIVFIYNFLFNLFNIHTIDSEIRRAYIEALKDFNEFRDTNLHPELKIISSDFVVHKWGRITQTEDMFYKVMMILPKNYTFKKAKEHDLKSFSAFTWEGKIYIVKENFNRKSIKETILHELEHLYQKRFNITDDGTFDGERAKASVIEGDAKFTSKMILNYKIEKENTSTFEINEENAYFMLSYLPYVYGYNFIIEVYNRTKSTDIILENPPKSMEQVIHPKKYFSKEEFIVPKAHLKNEIRNDRLGEMFLFIFLATHVLDSASFHASKGWNGDTFVMNHTSWLWNISFDSEEDAIQFEFAVNIMLQKIGEKSDGVYIISDKYIPQSINVERKGSFVVIKSSLR